MRGDSSQFYADIAARLMHRAKILGADEVDVVCGCETSLSFEQRLGKPSESERSESADIGLRVIIGKRQAIVSSSDFGDEALESLVERAISMAKVVPEDAYCGIADKEQLGVECDLDLQSADTDEPTVDTLKARAAEAEETALQTKGISNSEGSSAGWQKSESLIASSNGLEIYDVSTSHSVGLSIIAGEGAAMQSAYDYAVSVFGEDLESPKALGLSAAEKALAKLHPGKVPSGEFPVLFDPEVSGSLLRSLASAINGIAVARGTSFLKESMGQKIMPEAINIIDDPHIVRGLASTPIDAEGLANERCHLVKNGVLQCWLLHLASARQLGLTPNGHAARGIASPPSPSISNLYLQAGDISRKDLLGSVKKGLLVTELMGMGVNLITGDYSQGASGFLIENGNITKPVSEVTIASNLKDMYSAMVAADDLRFRRRVNAPTILIEKMTIAGL